MKGLIITADLAEDRELFYPYYRLQEEGLEVDVASFAPGTITGKRSIEMSANIGLRDVRPEDYDVLILPGGKAPARLRHDSEVMRIVRELAAAEKPIGAICHGPQILLSAGLLKGKRATCAPSMKHELAEFGAHYVDEEVVVDGNIITSRLPGDLPAFGRELMKQLKG
jgi:protease I